LTDSVAGAKVVDAIQLNRSSTRRRSVVTATTTARPAPIASDRAPAVALVPSDHDGWQALAAASLGRLLSGPEVAAVEHLPAEIALDLLFPDLDDAARHEALATLG
jgi:hypothetical protein